MDSPQKPPGKPPTDEQLFLEFRRGNAHALTILFDRHKQELLLYLKRVVRTHVLQDAEDLLQETWIHVYQNSFIGYNDRQKFKSWLFTIAHNLAINWSKRKTEAPDKQELLQSTEKTYSDRLPFGLTKPVIQQCLNKLTENARNVLHERFWNNKTCQQIADETSRSRGAVLNASFNALKRMRKLLTNHIETQKIAKQLPKESKRVEIKGDKNNFQVSSKNIKSKKKSIVIINRGSSPKGGAHP